MLFAPRLRKGNGNAVKRGTTRLRKRQRLAHSKTLRAALGEHFVAGVLAPLRLCVNP